MSSSQFVPWNQLASSRSLVALAVVVATISTFVFTPKSYADESIAPATSSSTPDVPQNVAAPDVPPTSTAPAKIHEGNVVKTEIHASIEEDKSPDKAPEQSPEPEQAKIENLTAPVPGNQDGMPQPTFNAVNTINTNLSSPPETPPALIRSDAVEIGTYKDSVTTNALTYPLNDPVNGQFTGQTAPLALRESSDSSQTVLPAMQSKYQELPLSLDDAKNRLGQLKLMAAGTRPQDALEHVNQFIRWLSDIVDAHTKMAAAFSKNESTKSLATSEKQMTTKFSHLRFESQLLKADLLIEEHRNPEALAPLVEIVLAMPTNSIGKSAYQRLQELGFSAPDAQPSATTTSGAEAAMPVVEGKGKSEVEKTSAAETAETSKKIAMLPATQNSKKAVTNGKKQSLSKKAPKVTSKKSHKP